MSSKSSQQILKELDAAIDAMDMNGIDRGLNTLSTLETAAIKAEDVKLFSARIKKLDKENRHMNKPRKTMRIAVVAASIMLMGLTAYAAAAKLNLFSFQQGDKFITMRTTADITEQEAREFTTESQTPPATEGSEDVPTIINEVQPLTFDNVQQAREEMDMELVLPSAMPDMKLDSATGQIVNFGNGETRTAWLTYSDEQGRLFGVTTVRSILPAGNDITHYTTHDIDDGSLDSYKSKSGIEYTLLTESDETGERTAHIAMTMLGEYEYALVFFGFDEAERQAVIDSADLSVLS